MNNLGRRTSIFIRLFALWIFFGSLGAGAAFAASASSTSGAKNESIDELYERVKKEGGQLTLYIALSARSEEVILWKEIFGLR